MNLRRASQGPHMHFEGLLKDYKPWKSYRALNVDFLKNFTISPTGL